MEHRSQSTIYGTTILAVKKDGFVAIGGDGQVSLGSCIMKATAKKVRRIYKDKIIAGFAGATADAFTLFERLEKKLVQFNGELLRASVELAKDWRMDKYLRHLEAMLLVSDGNQIFIISGNGDVIEPENGVASIGSGGNYALSSARALIDIKGLTAEDIVKKSMRIAGEICIYTNTNLTIEILKSTEL